MAPDGNIHQIKTVSTMDISFLVSIHGSTRKLDHLIVPGRSQKIFTDAMDRVGKTRPNVHAAANVWTALSMAYLQDQLTETPEVLDGVGKKKDEDISGGVDIEKGKGEEWEAGEDGKDKDSSGGEGVEEEKGE